MESEYLRCWHRIHYYYYIGQASHPNPYRRVPAQPFHHLRPTLRKSFNLSGSTNCYPCGTRSQPFCSNQLRTFSQSLRQYTWRIRNDNMDFLLKGNNRRITELVRGSQLGGTGGGKSGGQEERNREDIEIWVEGGGEHRLSNA